jgi:uncharacterized protein YecA (UPF0149 family)
MESEKKVILVGGASSFARAAVTKALLEGGLNVITTETEETKNRGKTKPLDLPNIRLEDYDPVTYNRKVHGTTNGKRNQPCRCGSGKKTKKCCGTMRVK